MTRKTSSQISVIANSPELIPVAILQAVLLRGKGYNVEITPFHNSTKKNLGLSAKKGIPFALLVMKEDEIIIKNLAKSSQKSVSSIEEIEQFMKS